MPLKKGKKNVGYNISMEMKKHPNMPHKQAVAIAMSAAGTSKKKKKKGNV